ncbi:MAG: hypothetical protein Ct9H300mP28_14840 [Pseudomonadota bacterium]|nr:MAG: hypothetical protein Ct9H300mP28_14840 [Pseudomonadota bacterium]
MRHSFDIQVGSEEWRFLEKQFLDSWQIKDEVSTEPRRKQNRNNETFNENTGTYTNTTFRNEVDTDWVLPENRKWAEKIREKWMPTANTEARKIPLVIGNSKVKDSRKQRAFFDPSQPGMPAVFSVELATTDDVTRAVKLPVRILVIGGRQF